MSTNPVAGQRDPFAELEQALGNSRRLSALLAAAVMTTWDDVRAAEAAEQAAREAYDENPSDAASLAWEAARDSLDGTLRAYKASRSNQQVTGAVEVGGQDPLDVAELLEASRVASDEVRALLVETTAWLAERGL